MLEQTINSVAKTLIFFMSCSVPGTISDLHDITNVVAQVDPVGSGVVCAQKRFQRCSLQVGVPPSEVCHDLILHVGPSPLGMLHEIEG